MESYTTADIINDSSLNGKEEWVRKEDFVNYEDQVKGFFSPFNLDDPEENEAWKDL